MPLAEKKGITAHMLNHNLPIFVNAISTHERESSRNVRLEDSNVPDAMFIKFVYAHRMNYRNGDL